MNSTQMSHLPFYWTQTGVDHCQKHASSKQKQVESGKGSDA